MFEGEVNKTEETPCLSGLNVWKLRMVRLTEKLRERVKVLVNGCEQVSLGARVCVYERERKRERNGRKRKFWERHWAEQSTIWMGKCVVYVMVQSPLSPSLTSSTATTFNSCHKKHLPCSVAKWNLLRCCQMVKRSTCSYGKLLPYPLLIYNHTFLSVTKFKVQLSTRIDISMGFATCVLQWLGFESLPSNDCKSPMMDFSRKKPDFVLERAPEVQKPAQVVKNRVRYGHLPYWSSLAVHYSSCLPLLRPPHHFVFVYHLRRELERIYLQCSNPWHTSQAVQWR